MSKGNSVSLKNYFCARYGPTCKKINLAECR